MNNYESPNVAEIESAARFIQGSKIFCPTMIDTLFVIDFWHSYWDDIDETDD